MYGRVLSALFSFGGWFAKSIMAKFFLFFGLYFLTTEFMEVLLPLLPDSARLDMLLSYQAPGIWYFLNLFNVTWGLQVIFPAFVTRFIIRRVPVIG